MGDPIPSQVVLLTSGSRGDVEPFCHLGRALAERGHEVRLATHERFRPLADARGIPFAPLNDGLLELNDRQGGTGNPLALLREARRIIAGTLEEAWRAGAGAELIIHHPKALAGPTLAEALGVPAILALFVPMLTPTSEFAHPLLGGRDLGPLNRPSYAIDRLIVAPYRGTLNRWRKEHGLAPLPGLPRLDRVGRGEPTPILYPFSPTLVPRPADWPDRAHQTGFWFPTDTPGAGRPGLEERLERFLQAGPPPLYVGFGSMTGGDAMARTRAVLRSVERVGTRAVIATGWDGLAELRAEADPERVLFIEGAPHAELFPRVAAVVHHGGAGTTAAGLRAGRPTLICPFFGDQPFWGRRVAASGAGPEPIPQPRLSEATLAPALEALLSEPVRERARELGGRIRAERGLEEAVAVIESTLTRGRARHAPSRTRGSSGNDNCAGGG